MIRALNLRADKVNTIDVTFFTIGMLAGAVVILVAWRARSLSGAGAVAAGVVGTAAAAAGPGWVAILLAYFVSSSLVSRFGRARKLERTSGIVEKSGPRDAAQVMANGLVFALAAAASATGQVAGQLSLLAGVGALAASAADTWATEIGTLFGGAPRSILSCRPLPVGASGGVTATGLLASVAGATFMALVGVTVGLEPRQSAWVVIGGLAGSLVDSVAGAIVQRRQWCDACERFTEMRTHSCGTPTRHVGGLAVMENDAVNLVSTLAGGAVTLLLARAFA